MQTKLFIGGGFHDEHTDSKSVWVNVDADIPVRYPR